MTEALAVLNRSFQDFLDQGDLRVRNWPFMRNPFPGIAMIAAYIYFVKVAGPQFMKKRKPYDLRNTMAVYNFVLVLINLYVFVGIGRFGYFNGYSLKCQPVDYSNNYEAVKMAEMGYLFYLIKFVEFADTIFFVLRKKYNQISALHVIHHSIVPFSLWFGIKFAPGGYNALFPFLNSLVHVIMYSYYGLAALGDKYKKYLFWKKYMTYLQLAQFVVVIVYAVSLWYHQCDISKAFIAMNFIHAALFLGLFLNFFVKNYMVSQPRKKAPSYISFKFEKVPTPEEPKPKEEDIHTHARKFVSQLEREAESHLVLLHARCADIGRMQNGRAYNYCIPKTLNSFQSCNGFSVPESLKNRKSLKDL